MNEKEANAWLDTKRSMFVYFKCNVKYNDSLGRLRAYAKAEKYVRNTSPNLLAHKEGRDNDIRRAQCIVLYVDSLNCIGSSSMYVVQQIKQD